jgi:hypothetical protein
MVRTVTGCEWLWQVKICNPECRQSRVTLITRMVHEEMVPTKHTKYTNEAEPLAFVPFVCLVGKVLLHARLAGNRHAKKYLRKTR